MISFERTDCRPLSLRHASDLLQAIRHPIRLQILEALRREPATVGFVVDRLALEQPVVSRHLAILRKAGIVCARSEGRERIYRICHPQTLAILEVVFGKESDVAPRAAKPREGARNDPQAGARRATNEEFKEHSDERSD